MDETDSRSESEPSAEDEGAAAEPGAVDDEATTVDDGADADDVDIPWVLRRRSVKDDRPNVTQFFLQDETDRAERRFRSDVEELLDTDVYTLDLREAAYVVAMRHPDEVATVLQEWGYEYLD